MSFATPTLSVAQQISNVARVQFLQHFSAWKNGMLSVWRSADPQAVIDGWGTGAKDAFAQSAATAAYLADSAPRILTGDELAAKLADLAAVAALVKPFALNTDGTVTINPPVPAAPVDSAREA